MVKLACVKNRCLLLTRLGTFSTIRGTIVVAGGSNTPAEYGSTPGGDGQSEVVGRPPGTCPFSLRTLMTPFTIRSRLAASLEVRQKIESLSQLERDVPPPVRRIHPASNPERLSGVRSRDRDDHRSPLASGNRNSLKIRRCSYHFLVIICEAIGWRRRARLTSLNCGAIRFHMVEQMSVCFKSEENMRSGIDQSEPSLAACIDGKLDRRRAFAGCVVAGG